MKGKPRSKSASTGEPLKPLTVTIKQVETIGNLGHTKIYELIADGRLKTVKIDGRRLVVYSSLEALLTPPG